MKERNGKGAKRGKEKKKKHVLTASLNPIFSKVPAKDTGDVFFFFMAGFRRNKAKGRCNSLKENVHWFVNSTNLTEIDIKIFFQF